MKLCRKFTKRTSFRILVIHVFALQSPRASKMVMYSQLKCEAHIHANLLRQQLPFFTGFTDIIINLIINRHF